MERSRTLQELRDAVRRRRAAGESVGFVPTMGCLHEGHASLMRQARAGTDAVVVSIFVNPTQFGPGEDFEAYPRQLEADAELCEAEGVGILYTPDEAVMYPEGFSTFVQEESLSAPLCGQGRPGHFRGVCTVVTKLLNQVLPDRAFFGQKDAQQALVIQRMARDLDMPYEIRVCPIVREDDGLALSSRNRYLSPEERSHALALRRALEAMEAAFLAGERSCETLRSRGWEILATAPGVAPEYLELLSTSDLTPVRRAEGLVLVAVAARVGPARLIDNTLLDGATGELRLHL